MHEINHFEILLVDGDSHDAQLTQHALGKGKLANHIHIARDGAEAVEFIFCEGVHVSRLFEDKPKIILLDLELAQGGGLEVLERIQSDLRTSAIPVIALASSEEQGNLLKNEVSGVMGYIVKPVSFENFVQAMQQLGMHWLLVDQPLGARGQS